MKPCLIQQLLYFADGRWEEREGKHHLVTGLNINTKLPMNTFIVSLLWGLTVHNTASLQATDLPQKLTLVGFRL